MRMEGGEIIVCFSVCVECNFCVVTGRKEIAGFSCCWSSVWGCGPACLSVRLGREGEEDNRCLHALQLGDLDVGHKSEGRLKHRLVWWENLLTEEE